MPKVCHSQFSLSCQICSKKCFSPPKIFHYPVGWYMTDHRIICTVQCRCNCMILDITCVYLYTEWGEKAADGDQDRTVSKWVDVVQVICVCSWRRCWPRSHPEEYWRLEAKEQEASKANRQMTTAESIQKAQTYAFDHPRAREIYKHIGEMIAVDSEPFTLVDHIGFTRLMKLVEPRYKLPSDKYFSEKLIPEVYGKVCEEVKVLVSEVGHVSITTDVWSSVAQDSYISLTCHYISADFERQQVCLHAAPFNDRHTGEHIATMLTNCPQSWNLAEKLHAVVRDNGSNFVAGLRDEFPTFLVWRILFNLLSRMGVLPSLL